MLSHCHSKYLSLHIECHDDFYFSSEGCLFGCPLYNFDRSPVIILVFVYSRIISRTKKVLVLLLVTKSSHSLGHADCYITETN